MKYFVTSGAIEKTYHHDSHAEAAILFLETEDGPFGQIVSVISDLDSKATFFHTKTLLAEIEDHNQRFLTFSQENV